MSKRVLLTGSNGLLGQNLITLLRNQKGISLLATSKSSDQYPDPAGYQYLSCDLSDPASVRMLVDRSQPDVIIHAGAWTQVDPCETDRNACYAVNVSGTAALIQACQPLSPHFIYVSTDFVFSGTEGPYRETDEPNPVNYYGYTKWQGEKLVQSLSSPWSIVRTILLYGITPSMSRSNLPLWVMESLKKGQSIRVVEDQFRMPTWVEDLAAGITAIIVHHKQGIYHLSGPEELSILSFAQRVARHFQLDETLISPISSRNLDQAGTRPPATGFVLDKAIQQLDYRPRTIEQGLALLEKRIESSK